MSGVRGEAAPNNSHIAKRIVLCRAAGLSSKLRMDQSEALRYRSDFGTK